MKLATRIAAALLGLGLVAGAADAQTVDQRHYNQQERIGAGVESGRLTPHETARLEHQQASIHHQEARMRYRDGGRLTYRDRAILRHRENVASNHIWRAKHNRRWG
ncbi:MAG: hypothetical protein JOY99_03555 [Sphingomonadaceae bacterium]|nr:hypothetical protein [Sphingomonadaceae bacterium]